jgi:hypothetical protein
MKTCLIVNYWADTDSKVNMVLNLINQLKSTNIDIVYTSLTPIDRKISENCLYSFYHSENKLISIFDILEYEDLQMDNLFSFTTDNFKFYSASLTYQDVSFSVSKQLTTNLNYLKELGYTHFHLIVGDCDIHEDEINVFNKIEGTCHFLNKKAYFDDLTGKPNHDGLGSIYFFSEIDFFLKNFKKPNTLIDFFKTFTFDNKFCYFELVLKHLFKNSIDVLLSNNNKNDNIILSTFKKSKIDLISRYINDEVKLYLIPNKNDINLVDIFLITPNKNSFRLLLNNEIILDVSDSPGNWFMRTLKKQEYTVELLENNTTILKNTITNQVMNKLCNHTSFYD